MKGVKGVSADMFIKFINKVKKSDTEVDVDDYLWLVMQQWAASLEPFLTTAKEKLGTLQRQQLAYDEAKWGLVAGGQASKSQPPLLLHKMGELMESIYAKKNADIIQPGNIKVILHTHNTNTHVLLLIVW